MLTGWLPASVPRTNLPLSIRLVKVLAILGSLSSDTVKAGCIDSNATISDGTNSFRIRLFENINRRTAKR